MCYYSWPEHFPMGTIDAALSALNNCIPSICLLLQILAVEVRQPPCQLAKEDSRHLETHFLGKFALAVQLKKPMKMGWHCGTPRKRPKFGLRFCVVLKRARFATVPTSFSTKLRFYEHGFRSCGFTHPKKNPY